MKVPQTGNYWLGQHWLLLHVSLGPCLVQSGDECVCSPFDVYSGFFHLSFISVASPAFGNNEFDYCSKKIRQPRMKQRRSDQGGHVGRRLLA